MRLYCRIAATAAFALALGGCSLGSILGGGKPPASLLTLAPEVAAPSEYSRTASAGQAVTVSTPVIGKALRTARIPVQVTPTDVQYITDAQWVDTPDRLFQSLLAETIRRTTNRVVLDPRQATLDPGLLVTGELHSFGYDTATGMAVVRYDASLSTEGGTRVETRRFEASAPSDGTAASIGPALNRAANQVAQGVAQWIGSR